jgi:hypothetical protein
MKVTFPSRLYFIVLSELCPVLTLSKVTLPISADRFFLLLASQYILCCLLIFPLQFLIQLFVHILGTATAHLLSVFASLCLP